MKYVKFLFVSLLVILIFSEFSYAQQRITARGSFVYRKVGIHRGNQVRTVFTNYGVIAQPGDQGPRGAWKFDTNGYVGDVSPLVGLRLPIRDYNNDGILDTIVNVVITPVSRPGGGRTGPGGQFWGFEPIPGFANPVLNKLGKGVAMSHLPETWPDKWPDQPTWNYTGKPIIVNGKNVTPKVDWNGFFGRAQFNADQESYFWMDDNSDESMFQRNGFIPDTTDLARRGQALQVSVRGLQWSNFLAQDVLFWLYNITNDGTSTYDQAAFGILVGTYVGAEGDEYNDDASFFDVRQSITYSWDIEPGMGGKEYIRPSANPQWQPDPFAVGYISYAFLESPGNKFDGIDNDGDNINFSTNSPFFQQSDFQPKLIKAGDKLVLIDKKTFKRTIFTMPNDTVTVYSMGVPFFLAPNVTSLVEGNIDFQGNVNQNAYDGIDNNLNGIIDENSIQHFRQFKKSPTGVVLIDTLNPVQHFDYINGKTTDPMIDEARDDGIDNNSNWNILGDDVGLDGKPNTGDFGEGDGKPTSAFQLDNNGKLVDTGFPGEPNIDKTDVEESDQLGLTSFQYFVPAGAITMADERDMWRRLRPGFFDVPASVVNNVATKGEDGDFIYGTGYFPLLPHSTERFSLALAFGDNLRDVIKTKAVAQLIFNANYNFPKPPKKPTLKAVADNGKITLYWDKIAETSIDPTTKKMDFEGYKIYKGTDPDFTDAFQITDGNGKKVFYKPVAQFDLKDGITGFFTPSPALFDLTNGAPYFLGNDTGIQNFYIDTDVTNGRTYYYAVVAYDRGEAADDIFPSENTKFISKDAAGRISVDKNTVAIIPHGRVLGYVAPKQGTKLTRVSGISNVTPFYDVIDPTEVKTATYQVSFADSLVKGVRIAYAYSIKNTLTGTTLLKDEKLLPSNGNVFDGIRISIDTSYQVLDSIIVDTLRTRWVSSNNTDKKLKFVVSQFIFPPFIGIKEPSDFLFSFSDTYDDSSNVLTNIFGGIAPPARTNLNFKVFDITNRQNPKRLKFAFTEANSFRKDTLSLLDQVTLTDTTGNNVTWKIIFVGDSSDYVPKGGDSLFISMTKPITSNDLFSFTTEKARVDKGSIASQLNSIKVVPNPYIVSNVFEQPLPPTIRGRGERIINFTHIPSNATIDIYTSSGDHIRTLHQDGNINDGTVSWDVRTKEGLDVAYGVYFYVVQVPGISDKKLGKIAIIK